ncbi:exotoxin beta-grasp domain-containing protein [Staphylococcus lutrae]|uniref:exotoxin beta-grasp domain-containing protein n=1 Tax=Staphylococcus lutrae TaxID=155085 RepID=UPI000CD0B96A|nr:exotoxin [Staphylococcus lutrae]
MPITNAQPDPKPEELNKVSEYKKNKGTMGNIEVLYMNTPIMAENIKNTRQFLQHDLIFPISYSGYKEVRTELANKALADKYKNNQVDVFGVPYYYTCLVPKNETDEKIIFNGVCMYGGLTLHSSDNTNSNGIVVSATVDNRQKFSFIINTNKVNVTVQELDYKVRNWLTREKKLYERDGSAFETGYIKFIEKDHESFWYDLFPNKDLVPFIPYKFINIYGDNKTVDSSAIRIEVHLTTIKGSM